MTEPLKPCPFCGASDEHIIQKGSDEVGWSMVCALCLAVGPELADIPQAIQNTEAEAIAAWNRRASGWISVEERLPKPQLPVLVRTDYPRHSTAYVTKARRWWWELNHQDAERHEIITHWQPLPDPPEAT